MTRRIAQDWGASRETLRRFSTRLSIAAVCLAAMSLAPVRANGQSLTTPRGLYKSGHYEEAIDDANKAIDDGSWDEEWQILKLRAELMTGRYADAMESYKKAITRHSTSIRLRMLGTDVYRFNGLSPDEILAEIRQRVADTPTLYSDQASQIALGRYFLAQKADARQVLELFFDRVKTRNPEYADAYLATGELALEKSDDDLAADAYGRAVELDPENPDAHYGLAISVAALDPDKASGEIEKSLELNPRHIDSLLLQVDRLIDSEFYDEAIETLKTIYEVNSLNPPALAYEAVIAHLQGDFENERRLRDKALSTWTTNPLVDNLIGRKLSEKYRFAEGEAYQRRSLEFDPTYVPAKLQLSLDLLRLGDEDEGWSLANEVYELDGYNVQAHNLLSLHDSMLDFSTIEDDDFILRMDATEAEIYGQRAMELLHEAKKVLCEKYDYELTEPVIVEIFPNQDDFAMRTFGIPGGATGFLGVCFGNVITANSPSSQGESPSNWEAVLWHEFCHVVTLHKTQNRMPRWLSEGISVYEEKVANPAWGQSMDLGYRGMILDGKLTPVSELSAAFLRPESPVELQFAYFESAMVVEYLVQEHGMETLRAILDDLKQGLPINTVLSRHVGALDAFNVGFGKFAWDQAEALAPGGRLDIAAG